MTHNGHAPHVSAAARAHHCVSHTNAAKASNLHAFCARRRTPKSALAPTRLDHLCVIASNSTFVQRHSSGLRVTTDAQAFPQIPIDLRAASGIEVSTTPPLSGADRFARGRASQKPEQQQTPARPCT